MAAGGGLVQHSSITVNTEDGPREIQLLFGDITSLPIEDKVDVILVSAFQGDYIPTRTSLIGALHHNLGLSVRDLARNKKEDLRQHFHCWQSQSLPNHLPYGQLVCFETPMRQESRHPAELVGDVFRALIPMFQNQEKSVITPLLATGDQNYSQTVMLRAMLEAAVSWVRAGLPMKCLKIVMYKRDPSALSRDERALVDIFSQAARKVASAEKAEQREKKQAQFDVYLSYNQTDRDKVVEISKLLLKEDEKLRIFEVEQHLDKEAAFQEDILNTMLLSCRVVTVLSPAFLESSECMEKYNLALCVNRRAEKNILAPFYISTIVSMPTYMTLVQYIDLRNRDGTNRRLLSGISSFVVTLALAMKTTLPKPMQISYDVFISYSHQDSEQANHLLKLFQQMNPNLRIFFDRNELKTGFSWQQTLYHAVDNSSVLVALISNAYQASTVCQEEYSIALCRHLSERGDDKLELVPVLIEVCECLPNSMSEVPLVDGTMDFKETAEQVARAVIHFVTKKEKNFTIFNPVKTPIDVKQTFAAERTRLFDAQFSVQDGSVLHKSLDYSKVEAAAAEYRKTDAFSKKLLTLQARLAAEHISPVSTVDVTGDIAPSGGQDAVYDVAFVCADQQHGAFLDALFHNRAPHVSTNFHLDSEEAELLSLEKAKVCVLFLSTRMVTVRKTVGELDVALARQRRSSAQRVVYPVLIGSLARWPTYLRLVPCTVAVDDQLWVDVMVRAKFTVTSQESLPADMARAAAYLQKRYPTNLPLPTMIALSAACDDILAILQSGGQSEDSAKNMVISNMVSVGLQPGGVEEGEADKPGTDLVTKRKRTAGGTVRMLHTQQEGDSQTAERSPVHSTQSAPNSRNHETESSSTSSTCVLL